MRSKFYLQLPINSPYSRTYVTPKLTPLCLITLCLQKSIFDPAFTSFLSHVTLTNWLTGISCVGFKNLLKGLQLCPLFSRFLFVSNWTFSLEIRLFTCFFGLSRLRLVFLHLITCLIFSTFRIWWFFSCVANPSCFKCWENFVDFEKCWND
jgi:hypothetical protein